MSSRAMRARSTTTTFGLAEQHQGERGPPPGPKKRSAPSPPAIGGSEAEHGFSSWPSWGWAVDQSSDIRMAAATRRKYYTFLLRRTGGQTADPQKLLSSLPAAAFFGASVGSDQHVPEGLHLLQASARCPARRTTADRRRSTPGSPVAWRSTRSRFAQPAAPPPAGQHDCPCRRWSAAEFGRAVCSSATLTASTMALNGPRARLSAI